MAAAATFRAAPTGLTASPWQWLAVAIGAAAADRIVVVAVHQLGGVIGKTATCTIGGVTATLIAQGSGRLHGFYALVPSGTTADVVVTFSTAPTSAGIGVWTVSGSAATPLDVQSVFSGTDASRSVTLQEGNGFGLFFGTESVNTVIATTNATEDYDQSVVGTTGERVGAHDTTGGSRTITFASVSSIIGVSFDAPPMGGSLPVPGFDGPPAGVPSRMIGY